MVGKTALNKERYHLNGGPFQTFKERYHLNGGPFQTLIIIEFVKKIHIKWKE
jgi:hypothetical protein